MWAREQWVGERKRAFMITRKAHLFWCQSTRHFRVLSDCIMIQPKELKAFTSKASSVGFRACLTLLFLSGRKRTNHTHTPLRQLVSTSYFPEGPALLKRKDRRVPDSPISPTTRERAFATGSQEGSSDPLTQSTKRHCSFPLPENIACLCQHLILSPKLINLEGSEILPSNKLTS